MVDSVERCLLGSAEERVCQKDSSNYTSGKEYSSDYGCSPNPFALELVRKMRIPCLADV
jgi:hypothetical protein